jgi:cytidine deaminase
MEKPDPKGLVARAFEAARASYSPYSRFAVGAALLCADGTVVTGTNVENRSYGLTICAERSAIVAAVSQGRRRFSALAIACPTGEGPVGPCGACRQVVSEFCPSEMPVYFAGKSGEWATTTVGALLPADSLHDLKEGGPGR